MVEKPADVLRRLTETRAAVNATAATVTREALDAAERDRRDPATSVELERK